MIRRATGDSFILLPQNDHAEISGQIAAHWGNDQFVSLSPRDAVVQAIRSHDAGWTLHDRRPTLNSKKLPASFYDTSAVWFTPTWSGSIAVATRRGGAMAGLLVSWHFTFLSRSFPMQEQAGEAVELVEGFNQVQHAAQAEFCRSLRLSETLADYPPRPVKEEGRNALYCLSVLRHCDWISLMLCDPELPEPMCNPPSDVGAGLMPSMTAQRLDERTLRLDPWPLHVPRLETRISGKRVPARLYDSDADFLRTFTEAPSETLELTLLGPGR